MRNSIVLSRVGVCIFLLTSFLIKVSAQSPKIDSLLLVIDSSQIEDSSKVVAYFDLGRFLSSEFPDKAYAYLENGMELLKNSALKPTSINHLDFNYMKSAIEVDRNDFEAALNRLAEIEQNINEAVKKDRLHVRIISQRGEIKLKQKNIEGGLSDYYEALALAKDYESYRLQNVMHTKLGIHYYREEFIDSAMYHMVQAADFNEKSGKSSIIYDYINLGILCDENENDELALEYYQKTLDVRNSAPSLAIPATALKNMGIIYSEREDYTLALEYLDKASIIADSLDKKGLRESIRIEKGLVQIKLENSEFAEISFKKAYDYFKSVNDENGVYRASLLLAKIQDEKNIKGARKYYQEAKEILNSGVIEHKEVNKFAKLFAETAEIFSDYENATKAYKKHLNQIEGNFIKEQRVKVLQLQTEYETKLGLATQSLKIKALESEKAKTRVTFGLLGLLSVLLTIIVFQITNSRKRNLFNSTLEKRSNELARLNKELLRSNEELERFAFIASHDLKTPLLTINGFIDLIQKEIKPYENANLNKYTDIILNAGGRMSNLISDVLEFSKISKMEIDENRTPTDIYEVIEEVKISLKANPAIDDATIEVSRGIPDIYISKTSYSSLLQNLISNGIKFNKSSTPQNRNRASTNF